MNILTRLFLFLMGTLTLRLEGEYCERLLNVMASNNISFWKPLKKDDGIHITVLKKDFLKIRKFRRNTGVKIKIIKKKGLPLLIGRYKHRYGIALGFIIFIVALNLMSGRMWMIRVYGNIEISEKEINNYFESEGVYKGIPMKNIDSDILKQRIILSFDNIAWASVNKQGSVIEVNITEFTSEYSDETPCNIVSGYDAVIKKVNVSKGSVGVKIGDTVAKNQLLVSGVVNYGAGNSFVHPRGEIIGEIHLKKIISIKKLQETALPTGESTKRLSLDIMGLKIPLYLGDIHREYKIDDTYEYMNIFGGKIPIIIHKAEYSFVNKMYTEISMQSAKELADKSLSDFSEEIGATVVKSNVITVDEGEDEYTFNYDIVCFLDIGVFVPMEIE